MKGSRGFVLKWNCSIGSLQDIWIRADLSLKVYLNNLWAKIRKAVAFMLLRFMEWLDLFSYQNLTHLCIEWLDHVICRFAVKFWHTNFNIRGLALLVKDVMDYQKFC
jgi:hypothetical protein